jgi:flavin reductase (DIM6/NTAB) family NADH-FMN oxidoreductase RutF
VHITSEPPILYFGTPVVLISTNNEDGSPNLAPMSSAFWLGWRCILGIGSSGKTAQNLLRTRECVLNLPSEAEVTQVNRLALTTGRYPVPAFKSERGYRYVRDKFGISGLTPVQSETVLPPRVLECPVQLEASLEAVHELAADDPNQRGGALVLEARIRRVHVDEQIVMPGHLNRIDPDRWRPLIMSFQHFYGLAPNQLQRSELATVPESMYWGPDIERARDETRAAEVEPKSA